MQNEVAGLKFQSGDFAFQSGDLKILSANFVSPLVNPVSRPVKQQIHFPFSTARPANAARKSQILYFQSKCKHFRLTLPAVK